MKERVDEFQKEVKDSAQKIFMAGLGALTMVGEEGSKLFNKLVERGESYESDKDSAMGKAKQTMDDAKAKAEDVWSRFEGAFNDKVAAALQKLGVPTRDEINSLTQRVDALVEAIEKLDVAKKKG